MRSTRRWQRRLVLMLVGLLIASGVVMARPRNALAVGEAVQVFLSSDNGQYTLSPQTNLAFTAPDGTSATTINVDPNTTYQSMFGIGGSFDHLTIYHLRRMSASTRQAVLKKLVDPTNGIGYNWIRICFGTPDATLEPYYTYADVKGPDSDPLANFSIQKDIDNDNIAIIKEVLSYNPDIKILASQWSPPAWMKSSNSLNGGTFGSGWLQTLAEYLRRAVQAYNAQGIPIYALTMQNEPGVSVDYPSMQLVEFQEAQLLLELKSQFSTAGIATKVWIYDQSYPSTQYYVDPMLDRTSYPYVLPSVDGIAFHDYEGDPGEMTRVHNKYPDKEIHMTEKSAGLDVGTSASMITVFRNWAQSWLDWVTVGDGTGANNGPYELGGLVNNTPGDANAITYTSGYYHMGQFTKFIKRDAVRIASDEGASSTVRTVAFRNPDGQRVLVVTNETNNNQTFKVVTSENGQFLATIPARTTGTYLWSGTTSGGGGTSGAPIGKKIWLRAAVNSKYVSAENAGNGPLVASAGSPSWWEEFTVLDAGNGKIGLRASVNGNNVQASNGGNSALIANTTNLQLWEQFEWVDRGNGVIALRAAVNNKFVSAENYGNSALIARSDSASLWEEFTWGINP